MNTAGFEWNRFLETGQVELWSVPPFRRAAAARLIESCEDWLAGRPNPVERDSARDRLLALWPRLMERVGVLSGSG